MTQAIDAQILAAYIYLSLFAPFFSAKIAFSFSCILLHTDLQFLLLFTLSEPLLSCIISVMLYF